MRSFIPALTLILMLAVFCGIYSSASERFFTEIYNCAEKLEKNRFENPQNKNLIKQLEDTFLKKEQIFMPFMNHDILEEAKDHIVRASILYDLGNKDLFFLEIRTLKTHLGDIIDEQKATFSNILKK